MKILIKLFLLAQLLGSCNGLKSLKTSLAGSTLYERYALSLKNSGLSESPMVIAWKEAGIKVFDDSVSISLPFTESGFFQASSPEARSYRFEVKEGQVLTITGKSKTPPKGLLFLDLFVFKNGQWKEVANADTTLLLHYEFDKASSCLLRVQPELLINAYFTISIARTPVLINPVEGANNKSIGSFYGDARDKGGRKHEGVDIFASKGTPVLAPTNGHISRVNTTKIGGKVVWMFDFKRGHSYYFAHLDSQMVHVGQQVKQGDVLGTVGNTGNAITTPPHLHFGIYQTGSKDPIHYIRTLEGALDAAVLDTLFHSQAFRVNVPKTSLYKTPDKKSSASWQLTQKEYAKVVGYTKDWYRVVLPNGMEGYVSRKFLVPAEKGEFQQLTKDSFLLDLAEENAIPLAILTSQEEVEVLAKYDKYSYVRTKQGLVGWIVLQQNG